MSEIDADMDRAAVSYWLSVAAKAKSGLQKSASLTQAADMLREARAEARIPDSAEQPTLNEREAPQLDVLRPPKMRL